MRMPPWSCPEGLTRDGDSGESRCLVWGLLMLLIPGSPGYPGGPGQLVRVTGHAGERASAWLSPSSNTGSTALGKPGCSESQCSLPESGVIYPAT